MVVMLSMLACLLGGIAIGMSIAVLRLTRRLDQRIGKDGCKPISVDMGPGHR